VNPCNSLVSVSGIGGCAALLLLTGCATGLGPKAIRSGYRKMTQ